MDQPENIILIASIVRQLDGIPLAIELAASRAASLGVAHLAASLDNPLAILRKGRRTAPPRQQTLRATLDWSYKSLTEQEKSLLQDIAVFAGPFKAAAARALSSSIADQDEFHESFDGLFLKSFLSVVGGDGTYRLLETTRRYALEKLNDAGRAQSQHIAHAIYCEDELGSAEQDWKVFSTPEWLHRYSSLVNDVRAAIRWSMADTINSQYGIALIAKSHVLWLQLGLMSEQAPLLDWALDVVDGSIHAGSAIEMQLRIARGGVLYHTISFVDDELAAREFVLAADIAFANGDVAKYVQAMTGAVSIWTSNGQYTRSIEVAAEIRAKLSEIPANSFSRMLDNAYFFRGDLADAVREAHGALENAKGALRTTQNTGVGYEQRMIASTILLFTEFLEGRTISTFDHLQSLVDEAERLNYGISTLLLLMSGAIPIACLAGRRDEALTYLRIVEQVVQAQNLHRWGSWLKGYHKIITDLAPEAELAEEFADAVGVKLDYFVTLAGDRAPILALDRSLAGEGGWSRPELLRLKAMRLAKTDIEQAKSLIAESLTVSRKMGAVFWELRAAKSGFSLDATAFHRDLQEAISKADAFLLAILLPGTAEPKRPETGYV